MGHERFENRGLGGYDRRMVRRAARVALLAVTAMMALGPRSARAQPGSVDRARLATLEARLAQDASDTQAGCNAGWLLFRLDRHEDAALRLDRALVNLMDVRGRAARRRAGACLYSRGRVAETLDEVQLAREYYELSLARRPNDVVRARLDALPSAPTGVRPGHWESGGAAGAVARPSLRAIVASLQSECDSPPCTIEEVATLRTSDARLAEVVLLFVRNRSTPFDWGPLVLVIRRGATWITGDIIAVLDNPGSGRETISVDLSARPTPEGPVLWVDLSHDHVDRELGDEDSWRRRFVVVRWLIDEAAHGWEMTRSRESSGPSGNDDWRIRIDPNPDGTVRVTGSRRAPPASRRRFGRHRIRDLDGLLDEQ